MQVMLPLYLVILSPAMAMYDLYLLPWYNEILLYESDVMTLVE